MKHLQTYQLFESGKVTTYGDLYRMYYDCFVELIDMNAFIGVSNSHRLIDIKEVIDEYDNSNDTEKINDKVTIETRGFITNSYENSPDNLAKIYEYMCDELSSDEDRFSEMSGLKIKNKSTQIRIVEYGVHIGDKRWKELQSLKGQNISGDYAFSFNVDNDGREYLDYTYIINGSGWGEPDKSFLKRMFSRNPHYDFIKLSENMIIKNISIVHEITK